MDFMAITLTLRNNPLYKNPVAKSIKKIVDTF